MNLLTKSSIRFFTVLIIMSFSVVVFAQFGGGAGTADSPYQIGTAAHLNAIRGEFLGQNTHFVLTANINLGEAPWNQGDGWEPIGDNATRFQGIFNGAEFTISGLTIDRNQQYQGLFGYTVAATLRNITLVDIDVNGAQFTGGLVGRADNTTVQNTVVSGEISSTAGSTGGLFGRYTGNVTDTYAHVDVSAPNGDRIGGFVGDGWGNMRRCGATGNVTGRNRVGGLAGNDYNNHQQGELFATGNVTGNNQVGGLFGLYQTSTYYDLYATGTVTGNDQVGGLVGRSEISSNIHRAYAIGRVITDGESGGLIGSEHDRAGTVNFSYWNMETTGQNESYGGEGKSTIEMLTQEAFQNWNFGDDGPWRMDENSYPYLAIEGDEAGEHNFPDTFILPPSHLSAEIGDDRDRIRLTWRRPTLLNPIGYHVYRDGDRLNEEMLENEQFTDTDVEEWTWYAYAVSAIYIVDEEEEESERSGGFRVIITDYEEGDGSEDSPYTVATAAQLDRVRNFMRLHFVQTANIDMTDVEWQSIGTMGDAFLGSYNGGEFSITGLSIQANQNYQGLFGYTSSARLTDITLEDVDISGSNYVGGLVGRADNTTINGCSAEGEVNGSSFVGGLIGYYSGTMMDSYANVDVEGIGNQVGGLIGDSWGNLHRCYATGNVTGQDLVGGLAGYDTNGSVNSCFAVGDVSGNNQVGGLLGRLRTSRLNDSYATGDVNGRGNVGGLIGTNTFQVFRSYSIGRVNGQNNVGGMIGVAEGNAAVENSYWNIRTSGHENSAGGEGRDERHMTFPYSDDTFVGWDFERVWVADNDNSNRGYPYFEWQPLFIAPQPDVATTPVPAHLSTGISVDIEELRWTYVQGGAYTNPVGFRVYFNSTGEFGEDDDFEWVAFDEGEQNFGCEDILPEQLGYLATYYWKVVPTTVDPNDDRSGSNRRGGNLYSGSRRELMNRNDAENVPVWRFTTEIYPNPVIATNPQPEHEAEEIPVGLENLGWTYTIDPEHRNPAGFRLYLNTTGEFGEDDEFVWVPFLAHQSNYTNSTILPEEIEYAQTYYWKVVPTTNVPEGRESDNRERRARSKGQRAWSIERGDAENVPVWSFSTITSETYPLPATNPDPEHLATGINLGLTSVSWDYMSSEIFADPVGFRVYMNTTGAFGQNAPFVWVDYIENQQTYISSEIVPDFLDSNTTYYWRVIPTTNHPDDRAESKLRRQNGKTSQRNDPLFRGDAHDSPIWRFTTGTTDADDETIIPFITELNSNYPNPFNPETTINFSLAKAGEVSIDVFNSRGQRVVSLVDSYMEAGKHNVTWNGRDSNNQEVSSGIYFYRMKNGSYTSTNKMIMMK